MEIRRRRDSDLEETDELFNRLYPIYGASPEVNRYNLKNEDPERYSESFVGIDEGRVIGSLDIKSLGGYPEEHGFFFTLIVHPDYRGRGNGRRLYSLTEHHLKYLDWREVYTRCDIADTDTLARIVRLGYKEAGREIDSILDLRTYRKPDDYEETLKYVAKQDVTIKTFGEIDDPEKERKYWRLNESTNADIPDPYPYKKRSFEEWRKKMSGPNGFIDAAHIGLDGTEFVAHTKLYFNYGPGNHAVTGSTGTLASHRNRGIAKALKYRMVDWAVANGIPSISTGNAEQNEYILRINRKLGFKPVTTWLYLVKKKRRNNGTNKEL